MRTRRRSPTEWATAVEVQGLRMAGKQMELPSAQRKVIGICRTKLKVQSPRMGDLITFCSRQARLYSARCRGQRALCLGDPHIRTLTTSPNQQTAIMHLLTEMPILTIIPAIPGGSAMVQWGQALEHVRQLLARFRRLGGTMAVLVMTSRRRLRMFHTTGVRASHRGCQ